MSAERIHSEMFLLMSTLRSMLGLSRSVLVRLCCLGILEIAGLVEFPRSTGSRANAEKRADVFAGAPC